MARKPANTKPAAQSDDTTTVKPVAPETAPDITDGATTLETPVIAGVVPVVANPDAQNTPGANDHGQSDGGESSDLPTVTADAAELPDADYMVVCHLKDGRRRAGRRWPSGETPISEGDLTDYQLAQLRGDPQFTVFSIEKD